MALALVDVRPVDARGFDADQNLALRRGRPRAQLDFERFRTARARRDNRPHPVALIAHPTLSAFPCSLAPRPLGRPAAFRQSPVDGSGRPVLGRRGPKRGQRFGPGAERREVGVAAGLHDVGQNGPGETEGAGDGNVGHADFAADPARSRQFRVQCAQARVQLAHHPVDPWLVAFFGRAQHPLVMALDRLFHDRERDAGRPQRREPPGRLRRGQRGDARIGAGEIVENDAGFHQGRSVVGKEGRRFEERVELRERVDMPEERDWPMYKRSFGDDQRNGDPAHIRRIKHSDELHEISSPTHRPTTEKQQAKGERRPGSACQRGPACARLACAVTKLNRPPG